MADYVLMLSVGWNVVAWLWVIITAYELLMAELDGRQNERKHIVKIVILFALVIGTLFI